MDEIENEGENYTRYWLPLEKSNGQQLIALTYVVKNPIGNVQTSKVYAKYILDGLKEHLKKSLKDGIPKEYLEEVKEIIRVNNPDINL